MPTRCGCASGIPLAIPARRATSRGKCGTIVRVDEAADIDDIEAHGGGSVTEPLYSVRFASRELWGEAGTEGDFVHIDLFERYLQEA